VNDFQYKEEKTMEEYAVIFSQYLNHKGLKLTEPRRCILETVFSMHTHFNAEELYDKIRGKTNAISLATVYRTIPLLLDAGLVQRAIRSEGRERYEHIFGHPKHIHWLCRNCGDLMETDLNTLYPILEKQAQDWKFKPESIELNVKGLCWKCTPIENETQSDEK
jgi:Fur family ferric uptake transcriptional regulator